MAMVEGKGSGRRGEWRWLIDLNRGMGRRGC
jgi:hypothetical protein